MFPPQLSLLPVSSRLSLPQLPGVYLYFDDAKNLLYIGKARNLNHRVASYFLNKDLGAKTENLVSRTKFIGHIITENETDAYLLEAFLVRQFQPKYNIDLKDGKNYPLVVITKEALPKVLIVRKIDLKGEYFGPFVPTVSINYVLKMLRRIYPFYTKIHKPNEICLSGQLGFCPCKNPENYKYSLKQIKLILSGKRPMAIKNLEREMKKFSLNQNFEQALIIKNKLDLLKNIGGGKFTPWEYVTNPNLTKDKRSLMVTRLENLLKIKIKRIEGIDISHTGFKQITASLVVFIDGVKNNKDYRHFKIKLKEASDVDAISEVVKRRFNHLEWPKPDLLLIDGGTAQVNAAQTPNIFVIGLAKREEIIVLSNGSQIELEKSDPALQLLQQIRDEAHRFSRRLHFLLRTKNMLH